MTTRKLLASVRAKHDFTPAERRRIRQSADISLREMAEALGVSHGAVFQWEKGRYAPQHGDNVKNYFRLLRQLREIVDAEDP